MIPHDCQLLENFAHHIGMRERTTSSVAIRGVADARHVELRLEPSGSVVFECLSGPEAGDQHEISSLAELRLMQWPS